MSKKKTNIMIVLLFLAELFIMITRNSLIDTLPDHNNDQSRRESIMTVGDIIYNDNFDFNANYAIYKCDLLRY